MASIWDGYDPADPYGLNKMFKTPNPAGSLRSLQTGFAPKGFDLSSIGSQLDLMGGSSAPWDSSQGFQEGNADSYNAIDLQQDPSSWLGSIGGKIGATTDWMGKNADAIGAIGGGIKAFTDAFNSIQGLKLAKKQMKLMQQKFDFDKGAITKAAAQQGDDLIRTRSAVEGRPVSDYASLKKNTTL